MLRMSGRIVAPLNLEDQGLRPVVSFAALEKADAGSYSYQRVLSASVQGEFPSGFTLDLHQPPPADALAPFVGGEPAYAQGRLMVVAADFPAIVRQIRGDTRPIPECTEASLCPRSTVCEGKPVDDRGIVEQDRDLPAGQACLSRIETCRFDEADPLAQPTCTTLREEGDPKLHMAGYADRILIMFFAEPVDADTWLAVEYNAGNAISAGYHAYLTPELPTRSVEVVPEEPSPSAQCQQQVEADLLADYNAEHGTNLLSAPSSAGSDEDPTMFAYFEWQRAIFREMRKRGCDHPQLLQELGPDDPIEITLDPGVPQPL